MWFKQLQLFQLTDSSTYQINTLIDKLEPLAFKPCLPSTFSSVGWVSPVDEEDAQLARSINGCIMLCLQVEDKILPATVIRQELSERIKHIETTESRKVYQKEKLALKDDIIMTLLPRAFSKHTKLYAYIDTKNQWLVLGTNNTKKAEQFISMFKRSISDKVHPFEIKKLSSTMTHWLKNQNYPSSFAIEKACVLQDPNQQNRIIRCQHQDLFASGIQALIKDGCEAQQLALSWHDQVNFVLSSTFSLSGIKFLDHVKEQISEIEAETKQQLFHADFLIMTGTFSSLLKELLGQFIEIGGSSEKSTAIPAKADADQ